MGTAIDRLRAALSDRYELDRELGAGGMATVYLATDRKHRRRVAVKVLRPDVIASVGPARFLREIEIAARLVHPNILGLHDSGEADGFLFYVMPYVEGDSLRDRLRRDGKLPVEAVVRIVDEIADALEHAHAHGVVHRDIKPENILFESGHAVIADFGIARALTVSADDAVTVTGVALGTPAYMSPEQATGERDLDARCDVYSLGCVAYEMLTGERAFAGASVQAVIARKLGGEPASPRSIARELPDDVERVVLKAMARSPDDRYPTVRQFADALRSSALGPERSITRRGRRVAPLVAAVVLVAALGTVAAFVWGRNDGVTALAVLPFSSEGDATPAYIVDGLHDQVISELGPLPLRVISRTSVMRFRDSSLTIPEVARRLRVDAVVEGTLYRQGDNVQIQVRLLRALPRERQLWSRRYDAGERGLVTLHASVARGIAEQLGFAAAPNDTVNVPSVANGAPASVANNSAAHNVTLLGRYQLYRRTEVGLDSARLAFREAIRLDSSYAPAHAGLAEALAMTVDWHYTQVDPIATAREAIQSANRAIAIDSRSADAYAARGRALSASHAPAERIRRDFETAIRLKPQHANAHGWFAMDLAWQGREAESKAEDEMAVAIDPIAPGRRMGFAISALNYGDHPTALREARAAIEMERSLLPPRGVEALALLLQGNPAECMKVDLDRYQAIRALCLHSIGQVDSARRLIDSLKTSVTTAMDKGGPYTEVVRGESLAMYYAWVGDVEATLTWMRHAATISTAAAPFLYIRSGIFARVRADTRFTTELEALKQDIWRRVNTPPLLSQ